MCEPCGSSFVFGYDSVIGYRVQGPAVFLCCASCKENVGPDWSFVEKGYPLPDDLRFMGFTEFDDLIHEGATTRPNSPSMVEVIPASRLCVSSFSIVNGKFSSGGDPHPTPDGGRVVPDADCRGYRGLRRILRVGGLVAENPFDAIFPRHPWAPCIHGICLQGPTQSVFFYGVCEECTSADCWDPVKNGGWAHRFSTD